MPIDKLTKEQCCGCNACGDICPTKAITFETDNEGFWYPKVDQETCINCELCTRVCPEINSESLKKNDFEKPYCFAAENKNLEVVFDSTSGGLFSAFADRMYRDGGYVGGAVFSEDYRSVKHYISADKKDLPRLRSSKYLQSDLSGFYNEVQRLLKAREKVAVCGCPCQMAALKLFLRRPYENLLILDFVCLGINSPLIWQKYLDTFEERYGSPVVYAKSKSKELGWRNLTLKVKLNDGRIKFEPRNENIFTKGYIVTHSFIRPSCYECKYRGFPRVSDVSLADFWGIEKHDRSLEKNLGTSLVMVNSEKGKRFFNKIIGRLNYIEVPLEVALADNPAVTKSPSKPIINRFQFFEDIKSYSFSEVAKRYNFSNSKSGKKSKRDYIKFCLRTLKRIVEAFPHLQSSIRSLKSNSIKNILLGNYISFAPYGYGEIAKTANIFLKGKLRIGVGKTKNNHRETKIIIDKNATLRVEGNFNFGFGSDVEIFSGGELIIKGGGGTNVNCTIICANKIVIGEGVMMGRGVSIRDNNGNHFINRSGYKNSRPVIIEDKAWLCEGCTIMPGVKIGHGAIIGAHAFVTQNVPPNTMVSGNPAVVVDEEVLWKY